MAHELEGRHALITGAGTGIGAAIALRLAQAGCRLTLCGRSHETLQAQAEALRTQVPDVAVLIAPMDVAEEHAVQAAVQQAQARFGPVNILVNNAGQAQSQPFAKTDGALWQQMLNVNLTGTYHCIRAVLPGMLEAANAQDGGTPGRIVNIASTAGLKGYAYVSAYVAAKHGVVGLTKALALELARKGVTVNIQTREQLEHAFQHAAQAARGPVLVEKFFPGSDYRLLVVGDRLVAAARREPPLVTGDGRHTVRQLVDRVNADPRRGDGHATSLTKIRFDEVALARLKEQGYDADSVPAKGARVILRNNANLSTGGTATDVTDDVHPEVAARAIAAAQMVGLDICGVDVVCESVLRPLEEQSGGIVEVNAAPGLRMHLNPSFGKGRDVGEAIVQLMFPKGDDGRIPVIAVTGTNGKTTTVRLTSHLLRSHGLRVGMTNTDGVYINGRQIDSGDCSGPRSARNVLMHPDVDAAVLETARGGMLREGLAFDRCQVAVVTNIGMGDHLGLNYITTVEDLAVLKRVIVQNVAKSGMAVLNAADPIVAAMAANCPGQVTFFAFDSHHPVIATHRAQGKRVLFVEDDQIVAMQGNMQVRIPLSEVPVTRSGAITFQIENAMASIAAAWAVGVPWDVICKGLASFVSDAQAVPGRFNVFDFRGATVIADYGHNPDAIKALVQAVTNLPAQRRSVVISGAGDRRDDDIREQTRIIGDAFDEVVLYQDACQRGRVDGEVLGLLRQGLEGAQRTSKVDEIYGEFKAIDQAMDRLKSGDLCLILIDQVDEALAHIMRRVNTSTTSA